jgi:hypothetical protein
MVTNLILTLSAILLTSIFSLLGGIHFYWAFGGKWAIEKALPTKEDEVSVLNPKQFGTVFVGLGLLFFGVFYLLKTGLIGFQFPIWIDSYGGWIIPSIFILRAIGDFRYVGFFKTIKNTKFGRADTQLFSPLCLAIGLIGSLIQLY